MNKRKYPVGAEVLSAGGVSFRVWAPKRRSVEVVQDSGGGSIALHPVASGYFEGVGQNASHGTRYTFRLDGGDAFPDPASRFQPEGPHGASQVIDPARFAWSDHGWNGKSIRGQVIYEMHP